MKNIQNVQQDNNNNTNKKTTIEATQKQIYSKFQCQDNSTVYHNLQNDSDINYQRKIPNRNKYNFSFFQVIIIGVIALFIGILQGIAYQKSNYQCLSNSKISSFKGFKGSNYRLINDQRFYRRTVFNQQNAQKPFGKHEIFFLNITKIIPNPGKDWRSLNPFDNKGHYDTKYTLTTPDFNKLINKIDFQKVKEDILDYPAYELLEFENDKVINESQSKLKYEYFKNDSQIQNYLQNLKKQAYARKQQNSNDLKFQLTTKLVRSPTKRQVLQAQYYLFNKNYSIGSRSRQSPICIYGGGYNLYKRDQFKQFFQTIQRLNYTNYHVVYVDDNSQDEFSYKVYDYIKTNNFKVKNRIKIIRTLQTIGNLGNLFIFINKYCNEEDTVVMMDGDDGFVGTQPLQVLNKLYEQQKDCWYIYTKLIYYNPKQDKIAPGDSSYFLSLKTSEYRRTGLWRASSLRSFKAKLIKIMPIYQFIQYHFDSETGLGWPVFPISSADRFLIYALFQLAGNDRIKFLDEYFYNYYPYGLNTRNCYLPHQSYDAGKSLLLTPLQKLGSLQQKPVQVKNYSFPQDKFRDTILMNGNAFNFGCYVK